MREFIKDYNEMLVKPQIKFIKKHWVGYGVITLIGGIAGYLAGKSLAKSIDETLMVSSDGEES